MRSPGQGKWRQPGRGRRLRCQTKGTDAARGIIWYKTFHYSKPCRWCGQRARDCVEGEIGRIEGIRFVGGSEIVFSTPNDPDAWKGIGTFEPMV